MPTGELVALASGFTFGITGIIDKFLVVRVRPLTLGAASIFGGGVFCLFLTVILGKLDDLAHAPPEYLLLAIAGGMCSNGLGYPLFLLFLRSVDVNKASPLSHGFSSLFGLLSGVVLLGESPSSLALAGMLSIVIGVYLLSFAQRRTLTSKQAAWLGVRGTAFLMSCTILWTVGFTIQSVAVKKVDPVLVNMVRLLTVGIILSCLARLGLDDLLLGRNPGTSALSGAQLPDGLGASVKRRISRGLGLQSLFAKPEQGAKARNRSIPWTLIIAILNGSISFGVGSLLYLIAIKKIGLALATVLGTTQLLYVMVLSVIVLRESLRPKTVLGVATIFAGVVLILF